MEQKRHDNIDDNIPCLNIHDTSPDIKNRWNSNILTNRVRTQIQTLWCLTFIITSGSSTWKRVFLYWVLRKTDKLHTIGCWGKLVNGIQSPFVDKLHANVWNIHPLSVCIEHTWTYMARQATSISYHRKTRSSYSFHMCRTYSCRYNHPKHRPNAPLSDGCFRSVVSTCSMVLKLCSV